MKSLLALLSFTAATLAANPYLDLKDDQPIVAQYSGKEWGDSVEGQQGEDGIPFSAKVTTQRVAAMPWGQVVRVEFAPKGERKIEPLYLLVSDDQILELVSEDMAKEVKTIGEMKKQPRFEKSDVRAVSKGSLKYQDGPWGTEIEIKGGICTYLTSHNSGHFTKFVWKKGAGLVEYGRGHGAMQDGFRLKAPGAPEASAKASKKSK